VGGDFRRQRVAAGAPRRYSQSTINATDSRRRSMPREDDDDLDISIGGSGYGYGGENIPNYLTQSILVTLCCCQIFGIIAIINAAQVNSHIAKGDYQAARKASDQAKMWCTLGFVFGIIINVIVGIIQIMAMHQPGGRGF
jgi:hypothetical protein